MKWKKCCLRNEQDRRREQPGDQVHPILAERLRQEEAHRQRFGHVRPIIHGDIAGHKVVAVGSEIHWSPEWKTFPDFLSHYTKLKLRPEWGTAELKKPTDEQHPLVQLYRRAAVVWNSQKRDENGLFSASPSGPMLAWLALGYDLYVLRHHQALEARLLRRLKDPRQYQGARHELFVTATFIRAGFSIDFEDEEDGSRRHPEFLAVHQKTGQKVAVEAKSRHRRGVLGHPGPPAPPSELKAGVHGLLEDAFGKPTDHPYVVCVDVNLPAGDQPIRNLPWFQEVLDTLSDQETAFADEPDRYTQILFTNQPLHYADNDGVAPRCNAVSVLAKRPRIPFMDLDLPIAIQRAAEQFGTIPNWFRRRLRPPDLSLYRRMSPGPHGARPWPSAPRRSHLAGGQRRPSRRSGSAEVEPPGMETGSRG